MSHCPNCGTENRPGARFCKGCRAPLDQPPAPAPQQPYQAPPPPPPPPPPEPFFDQPPPEPLDQPSPKPAKSKTPLIIGGIVAAVLILCCLCVAIVVALGMAGVIDLSFLPFFAQQPSTAKIMPTSAGSLATINPNAMNSEGYQHLVDVYGDLFEGEDALEQLTEELEGEYEISFEEDIQPWMGPELGFAVIDFGDPQKNEDPAFAFAVATRDRQASDAFLEKLRSAIEADGYDVSEETYKDVTYYVQEVKNEWESSLVFGTVGDTVILASDINAMESIIDTHKGDTGSLAENERYTKVMQALPSGASAYMFFDMESVMPLLEDSMSELPAESTEQLEAYEAFGVAVNLDKEGIQIDIALAFNPDKLTPDVLENMKTQAKANPGRLLEEVPADALGFLSAQDLAATWAAYVAGLQEDPQIKQQLEDIEDALGIKVDEDLFAWATGEYILAVVAAQSEEIPIGAFAIFETDDQQAAESTMDDLADAVEESMYVTFEDKNIEGVTMQVVADPDGEILLGYGFVDGRLVIGLLEDGLEGATGDVEPITNDETFKRVQAHLPKENTGYFYLNLERIWQLLYRDMPPETKDEIDPYIEPIKAVGIAAAVPDVDQGVTKSTIFIYIP